MALKKYLHILVFTLMLALVTVTAATAGGPPPPTATQTLPTGGQAKPGCSPDFKDFQDNHAQVLRVNDRAMHSQIVKRPDPSAGMTCFDQSMAVTARLGSIFSDQQIPGMVAANTGVFNLPLVDSLGGGGAMLSQALEANILPVMEQHVGDFSGALSELIGGTMVQNVFGPVNTAIGTVQSFVGTVNGTISGVMGLFSTIESAASIISTALPSIGIAALLPPLRSFLDQMQDMMNTAMDAVVGLINSALQAVMDLLFGTNIDCNRMANVWDDGDPNGGADSIQGNGPEIGASYISLNELLTQNVTGTNAGPQFMAELTSTFNTQILQDALNDVTSLLGSPGSNPVWKPVPYFPKTATQQQIYSQMTGYVAP